MKGNYQGLLLSLAMFGLTLGFILVVKLLL